MGNHMKLREKAEIVAWVKGALRGGRGEGVGGHAIDVVLEHLEFDSVKDVVNKGITAADWGIFRPLAVDQVRQEIFAELDREAEAIIDGAQRRRTRASGRCAGLLWLLNLEHLLQIEDFPRFQSAVVDALAGPADAVDLHRDEAGAGDICVGVDPEVAPVSGAAAEPVVDQARQAGAGDA